MTTKPLKYSEIMPKVAIEKLKLIGMDDLVCLIGKDLESISSALLESPYREEVSSLSKDKVSSLSLEKALLSNYVKTIESLIEASVGDIRGILEAVLKKFEVSNVKTMLRAVKAKMDVDEAMNHIVPVGSQEKRYGAILARSKGIEDLADSLSDVEYGLALKNVLIELKETSDLLPMEISLDRVAYEEILRSIEKLRGLDKTIARNILGIEIDALNIKIILRCKGMGLSPDQMKDYLMPSSVFDGKTLEGAMASKDVKSMTECLQTAEEIAKNPFYQNALRQFLKEHDAPLSRLETILDEWSLKTSLNTLKKYTHYYNIGFILAFLNLKWFEIKNLRAIIKGSERKSPPSRVRQHLTLPDEW